MKREKIPPKRGTPLRRNGPSILEILLNSENYESTFLLNGASFLTGKITNDDLLVEANDYFMTINIGEEEIPVYYSDDISEFEIIYDPYKYENSEKVNFTPEDFRDILNIPEGHVDTLPKWYSFKFTYPDYNLIFVKPGLGLSIQIHNQRNEFWEILRGRPIIINGNRVHYFVENKTNFEIPIGTYHSVINPNSDRFVVIKERWSGHFDEEDIERVYNPNNYH